MRAYRDDGLAYGIRANGEGYIFLNPQSWSVISGHADKEKAKKAMNSVKLHLATEFGTMLCDPFAKTDASVVKAPLYNKSMKENGAIFNHTQGWVIMAETMLGNGDQAYEYLKAFLPASFNDRAEIRQIEPYVYSQSTHSKFSPRFGASRLPWLTGAATWAYHSAMQYVLGFKPDYNGFSIDPCIPSTWKEFTMKRIFRGKILNITVTNNQHISKGVTCIHLNGEIIEGNSLSFNNLLTENDVRVIMGSEV
jgi:cellobiose phosphorylase